MFLSFLRDNNYIKDFPQLADGLMVIPLPVEEQCRGVLSEPLPNLQLLTGTSAGLLRLFDVGLFSRKVAAKIDRTLALPIIHLIGFFPRSTTAKVIRRRTASHGLLRIKNFPKFRKVTVKFTARSIVSHNSKTAS